MSQPITRTPRLNLDLDVTIEGDEMQGALPEPAGFLDPRSCSRDQRSRSYARKETADHDRRRQERAEVLDGDDLGRGHSPAPNGRTHLAVQDFTRTAAGSRCGIRSDRLRLVERLRGLPDTSLDRPPSRSPGPRRRARRRDSSDSLSVRGAVAMPRADS